MNFKSTLIVTAYAASTLFAATVYQNQVGFLTNGLKQIAVIDGAGKDVVFKDSAGTAALTVTAPEAQSWEPAGKSASLVDFSELKTPGTYKIYIGDEEVGHPVVISDNAYEGVTKGAESLLSIIDMLRDANSLASGERNRKALETARFWLYRKVFNFMDYSEFTAPENGFAARIGEMKALVRSHLAYRATSMMFIRRLVFLASPGCLKKRNKVI